MTTLERQTATHRYLKTFQKHETETPGTASAADDMSELSNLGRLKSDLDNTIGRIRPYLQNKALSDADWQKVNNLRQEAKSKLDSANSRINDQIQALPPTADRVMALQLQRYRRIFDQMAGDYNILSKQLDQRYQSFLLFNDNRHVTQKRGTAMDTGKVVVEAIMDVESLTEQACLNLDILKRGNDRMSQIYARLNTMVHEHLFDIHKLQKKHQLCAHT